MTRERERKDQCGPVHMHLRTTKWLLKCKEIMLPLDFTNNTSSLLKINNDKKKSTNGKISRQRAWGGVGVGIETERCV